MNKQIKVLTGLNGQFGDIAICVVACRALRERYPNCHITFSMNEKYKGVKPAFMFNDLIDDFRIIQNYDDYPGEKDKLYLAQNHFDIIHNPNQPTLDNYWWLRQHHTEAVCENFGLTPPSNLEITLTPWFATKHKYRNCVAIAPYTSAGSARDISDRISLEVIKYVHSLGFETVQLGLPTANRLPTTHGIIGGTVFGDIVAAKSCKALITADTGINYLMSGYRHRTLGLYNWSCYPMRPPLVNRIPKNPNAKYIEARTTDELNLNEVKDSIDWLLLGGEIDARL